MGLHQSEEWILIWNFTFILALVRGFECVLLWRSYWYMNKRLLFPGIYLRAISSSLYFPLDIMQSFMNSVHCWPSHSQVHLLFLPRLSSKQEYIIRCQMGRSEVKAEKDGQEKQGVGGSGQVRTLLWWKRLMVLIGFDWRQGYDYLLSIFGYTYSFSAFFFLHIPLLLLTCLRFLILASLPFSALSGLPRDWRLGNCGVQTLTDGQSQCAQVSEASQ